MRLARKLFSTAELTDAGLPSDVLSQDTCSPGEQRKLHLLAAKQARPELLILDEPTSDLDEHGIDWLSRLLSEWSRGLLLVSHNRMLLRQFQHFFVMLSLDVDTCRAGSKKSKRACRPKESENNGNT